MSIRCTTCPGSRSARVTYLGVLDMRMCAHSCALIALVIGCLAATATAREWTSSDGKHTVDAEFVEQSDGAVRLRRKNGKVITVKVTELSRADQKYLTALPKAKLQTPDTDPEAAKAVQQQLREKGIRVGAAGLSLQSEIDLSKRLRGIAKVRRNLLATMRQQSIADGRVTENKAAITNFTQLNVRLNGQLANIGANQIRLNNKLIGAINANESQLQLFRENGLQLDQEANAARAKTNEVRETYIQTVLDLREIADAISDQYEQLASDRELGDVIGQLDDATGKKYAWKQSPSFRSSLRRLKSLEDTVLSENIPLQVERGGTMNVSVVIDGKHTEEMILDSGASLISLPQDVAARCGITVKPTDRTIILELADGSQISGKLARISSVRVGKFTVEDVECAVLGPEAVNASPLLGMSFLGNFKFEINAQEGKLTMVKVETSDSKSARSR